MTAVARKKPAVQEWQSFDGLVETTDASVLDVLDRVLNTGVTATGDLTLGVAGVDLIYLRLSALLCAVDRVLPPNPDRKTRRRRR
jgi:hypothetical protein